MFRLHSCAHTKDSFISNGFLNIYRINKFQTCLFMFNYEHNSMLRPLKMRLSNIQTSTLTISDHPIDSDLNFYLPSLKNLPYVILVFFSIDIAYLLKEFLAI